MEAKASPGAGAKKPHFVLLSSPGIGHLIPVLELGKRLVTHHNAAVTVFVVASRSSQAETELTTEAAAAAGGAPGSGNFFNVVRLPPPDLSNVLDPAAAMVTRLCVVMRELIPAIRAAVQSLAVRPTGLVVDLFGTECFVVAEELGIAKYVLGTSNAWFTALTIQLPVLDGEVEGEYVDQKEPLEIPGCRSVRPDEVVDPMLDRKDQVYIEYRRMGVEFRKADGILINTWEDLEPTTLAALRNDDFFGRKVIQGDILAIGPLVRCPTRPSNPTSQDLFSWLDKQPNESVVYVCFGSGGNLSPEQQIELAHGLERSQQRFLWVVRRPTGVKDSAFFSSGKSEEDTKGIHHDLDSRYGLPVGFVERTRHVGLVVPEWSPQSEVLSHVAVGAFVCHGGWNSTLESVRSGVAMMMWPLYSEQRMNATLVAEELQLASRTETMPWRGVVGRDEVEGMIREVMVGEKGKGVRERVKAAQRSGEKALKEGGSSYKALEMVVKKSC
ncbi:unnamed protein product [Linum tenue]|uniref:anthocyanidin 3-O-glucosyltransferase n=1 Tax=Linum tenue TaxID=586396 RepID=A0AAV0KCS6_9ROSI|nr:unnamed protein product [Linum tenue]